MKKFFNTKEGKIVTISLVMLVLALVALIVFTDNIVVVSVAIAIMLLSVLFGGTSANDYNTNK